MGRRGDFVRVVQVPILFGRYEGEVWFEETDGEKERLLGWVSAPWRRLTASAAGKAVGEFVVGFGADFKGGALGVRAGFGPGGGLIVVRRHGTLEVFLHAGTDAFEDAVGPLDGIGVDRLAVWIPMGLAPGATVFEPMMVDLVEGEAVVAVGLEILRKGDGLRGGATREMGFEVPDARRIGAASPT